MRDCALIRIPEEISTAWLESVIFDAPKSSQVSGTNAGGGGGSSSSRNSSNSNSTSSSSSNSNNTSNSNSNSTSNNNSNSSMHDSSGAEIHVQSFSLTRDTVGLGSVSTIVAVDYSDAAAAAAAGLPSSVFIKLPYLAALPFVRQPRYRTYEREFKFYRDLASPCCAPAATRDAAAAPEAIGAATALAVPRPIAGTFDEETHVFVLVLEDVVGLPHRGRFGDHASDLPLSQALASALGLARTHAAFWQPAGASGSTNCAQLPAWLPRMCQERGPAQVLYCNLPNSFAQFVDLWQSDASFPRAIFDDVGPRAAARYADICHEISQRPQTLIHGDPHQDNTAYSEQPDGSLNAIFCDWQLCSVGSGAFDIAYLLSNIVDPHEQQRIEDELVPKYHAALLRGGVSTAYTVDQCWREVALNWTAGFAWIASLSRAETLERLDARMHRILRKVALGWAFGMLRHADAIFACIE